FFASLGLLLVWEYFRKRLIVGSDFVRLRGLFTTRSLRFDDVSAAEWGRRHGRLTLHGGDQKLVIDFGSFSKADGRECIALLHSALPNTTQTDWMEFQSRSGILPLAHSRTFFTEETLRCQGQVLLVYSGILWLLYLLVPVPVADESMVHGLRLGCLPIVM